MKKRRFSYLLSIFVLLQARIVCRAADDLFRYDTNTPLQIKEKGVQQTGAATIKDISFAGAKGETLKAYLVLPKGNGPHPALLYSHWLAPNPNANRSQFLKEATSLAQYGVVSLLLDMPWAAPGWFAKRKIEDDYDFSISVIRNLRRATDLLASTKGVDRERIGFVGHDFGASYGAALFAVDPRIHCAVLMAGTPILSDWFLLESNLPEPQRSAYIAKVATLDPINLVGEAKKSPVLFQFAKRDTYISKEKALLFAGAANDPKDVRWYDSDHALNEEATNDRMDWLKNKLGIAKP